jgi:hypothetical protein
VAGLSWFDGPKPPILAKRCFFDFISVKSKKHRFAKIGGLGPSNQLNPATFIEVSVPSQESEQSSIYVNGIDPQSLRNDAYLTLFLIFLKFPNIVQRSRRLVNILVLEY